jgi:hypothetical protein
MYMPKFEEIFLSCILKAVMSNFKGDFDFVLIFDPENPLLEIFWPLRTFFALIFLFENVKIFLRFPNNESLMSISLYRFVRFSVDASLDNSDLLLEEFSLKPSSLVSLRFKLHVKTLLHSPV